MILALIFTTFSGASSSATSRGSASVRKKLARL